MGIPAAQRLLIGRVSALVGVALVVSACSGSGSGGGGGDNGNGSTTTPVSISESDQLVLEVQPIQVCNDAGIVCAQVDFFEAIADKIWGQAGIDVAFLPLNQLNDSTYLTTDEDEFSDLSFSGGAGAFGRHPDSTDTSGPINLWFVDRIQTSSGLVQFGNAWIGLNGALVSDDILAFNNGAGRIDVIAHELGHNLGLRHSTLGAGGAENVMSSGAVRTVPGSIDDIFPNGKRLSQLTSAQIDRARNSGFVRDTEADEILPVLSADAIALPVAASPDRTQTVQSAEPRTNVVVTAAVTVPENGPSLLTWLLLLPLGQVYRRFNR